MSYVERSCRDSDTKTTDNYRLISTHSTIDTDG